YESRVENLIKQELKFLGEIYAAYIDFKTLDQKENHQSSQRIVIVCELLERALLELELDVKERLLLLLKLLYSPEKMQAAAFNLRSLSVVNLARGLEILEHTITLSSKSLLLNILDNRSHSEKLQYLVEAKIGEYENMVISDRLHRLLMLSNFLSDWCLACCFHFAQVTRIPLTSSEILVSLRHPTGFVREAAIAYLNMVSHRVLLQILPQLEKDPHPLVAAQVKELLEKYLVKNYN
ncbi:MAG: MFS transporter, partial [Nostoc sp.]